MAILSAAVDHICSDFLLLFLLLLLLFGFFFLPIQHLIRNGTATCCFLFYWFIPCESTLALTKSPLLPSLGGFNLTYCIHSFSRDLMHTLIHDTHVNLFLFSPDEIINKCAIASCRISRFLLLPLNLHDSQERLLYRSHSRMQEPPSHFARCLSSHSYSLTRI